MRHEGRNPIGVTGVHFDTDSPAVFGTKIVIEIHRTDEERTLEEEMARGKEINKNDFHEIISQQNDMIDIVISYCFDDYDCTLQSDHLKLENTTNVLPII